MMCYYAPARSPTFKRSRWRVCLGSLWRIDLPMLTSLNVDAEAFDGDNRSDRKTIIYEPFNYLNTLTMKSGKWRGSGDQISRLCDSST